MFTTANAMIKLKMRRNSCMAHLLEVENKIIKIEMVIKYRLVNFNIKHIQDIKKINDIETFQLNEYKLCREHEIKYLIDNINNAELNINDLKTELSNLQTQGITLLKDIENLNNAIPDFEMITNYKVVESVKFAA